jgi:hypothetical protein
LAFFFARVNTSGDRVVNPHTAASPPASTKLADTFRKARVLLPVIHYAGHDEAHGSVDVAVEHGADGVFLIDQGIHAEALPMFADEILARHPELWVGVNLLGYEPANTFAHFDLAGVPIRGVWSDHGGVGFRRLPHIPYARGPVWVENSAKRMDEIRLRNPGLLYFGGAAFKGQAPVHDDDLAPLAREARRHMDVVTTSGPQTGVAAEPHRVAALAGAVEPPVAVGLASGVTPENVHLYPGVHAFLVATHIEADYGVLDPKKVRALADAIERGTSVVSGGGAAT